MQQVWKDGFLRSMSWHDAMLAADAAIFHDIGKLWLPPSICGKSGRLSAEEFALVKQHPVLGAVILSACTTGLGPSHIYAVEICLHHHERLDGSGYPDHLAGDEIAPYVQVVSLADCYDALVAPRSYRPPLTHEAAAALILSGQCGAFSPTLLKVLAAQARHIKDSIYRRHIHDPQTL